VKHTEIAIVGGGIIGLSAALELAAAGRQVTVFERGRAMQEASWAAAGMIAIRDPENPAALRSLAELSGQLYPQFLAAIERLSGERVPIRTTQAIQGVERPVPDNRILAREELEALAPGLSPTGGLQFFLHDEQSLDPRDLGRALPRAARAAGVILLEDTAVIAIREAAEGVRIETGAGETGGTASETWAAKSVIHCSGAWAEGLTGLPISPRKGQMVVVEDRTPDDRTTVRLRFVLRTPEVYLVPRGDGRIVIGATVEDAGFDKLVEEAAIAHLLERAATLWPPVRNARIVDSWAGLRPATHDELPVIDRCGMHSWAAVGHFRNGILLAPGTARLVRELVLGEAQSVDLTAFRCDRFGASSVHLSYESARGAQSDE
jgi:glycine oxidase